MPKFLLFVMKQESFAQSADKLLFGWFFAESQPASILSFCYYIFKGIGQKAVWRCALFFLSWIARHF